MIEPDTNNMKGGRALDIINYAFFQQTSDLKEALNSGLKLVGTEVAHNKDNINRIDKEVQQLRGNTDKKIDILMEKITALRCELVEMKSRFLWYPILGSLMLQLAGIATVFFVK